jgi:hypothetical protein
LTVTLELPASEFTDGEQGPIVRCQDCRRWVLMADYYSEVQGQLLPLVGNAVCSHSEITRTVETNEQGEEVVTLVETAPACSWSEVVRVLVDTTPIPEGGLLEFNTGDVVASTEKFG